MTDTSGKQETQSPTQRSSNERWFYQHDGMKKGPVDSEGFCALVESGAVLLTDVVWREGMSEWQSASEVPGLIPPHIIANAQSSPTLTKRRLSRRTAIVGLLFPLGLITSWVWMPRGQLACERVSGTVTYTDGTPLPVDGMVIHFHSFVRARDAETLPPVGVAVVDRDTGAFSYATTRLPGDGIISGLHKVTVHAAGEQPLPESIASTDYSERNRTVLRVNTKNKPFKILIDKP
jgi:hypothetical protein